jgi:hypothetical protein
MGGLEERPMESNSAIHQTNVENLFYDFPDETLEIAATKDEGASPITLYVCTALYYCPGP